jgi:hypothetical protein
MSEYRTLETGQTITWSNNNLVDWLHGTIRQTNKVMRVLGDEETAKTMMDGLRIYYNFMRPRMALDGKTRSKSKNRERSNT